MYTPYTQTPFPAMTLVVRSSSIGQPLISAVRGAMKDLDPTLPLSGIATMDQILSATVAQPRLIAQLVGGFAALALVLASIGIYGLMAYFVTQRAPEIAVRIALGAQRANILQLVMAQGLRLVSVGIVVGLAASLAMARLLVALLFGTSVTDAATLAGASAIFLFVALAACFFPARRAMKVDAMATLRDA
jgi:putative ABC transport system permease protein